MAITGMLLATAAPHAASAAPSSQPQQVVTVSIASTSATTGVLEAWERRGPDFVRVRGPLPVYIGEDGVGLASERRSRTPRGVFGITEAFGRAKDPGTSLPYVRVGLSHWWVSDVRSQHYNEMRVCSPGGSCGFRQAQSEQLGAIDAYRYAIVIDYNRDPPVAGRGSAFFLHVSEGKPTQGCISMAPANMMWLLRWLDPADDPVISINIADSAYAPLD